MQGGREKMLEWIQSGRVKREHEKLLETKHIPSKINLSQHMHAVGYKNALHCRVICSIFAFLCLLPQLGEHKTRKQYRVTVSDI